MEAKAKQEAEELIQEFVNVDSLRDFEGMDRDLAIECANIAVDQIIKAIDWHEFETPNK